MVIHPVFIQAFYYSIVMGLMAGVIGLLQKGFFWKYIKVRLSFGKFILVKVRAVNRDYFEVGRIEGSFLVYQHKTGGKEGKEAKRISVKGKDVFYRSLSVTWIDVDEEKNCVINPDYKGELGFDAVKYNDLYLRALYKPALNDNKERIMFLLLVGIIIAVVVLVFLAWQNYANIAMIAQQIARGTVTPGGI